MGNLRNYLLLVEASSPVSFLGHLHDAVEAAQVGFYFEEGGCWGMALALYDRLKAAHVPVKLAVSFRGEKPSHAMVKVGAKLYDYQGEIHHVVGPTTIVTPRKLFALALQAGHEREEVTKEEAAAIIDNAVDLSRRQIGLNKLDEGWEPSGTSDEHRANIVRNTEDEYRLPNLGKIVPPDQLHPMVKHGLRTITIYRGVPEGVTDIRPGDWVGLTRSYAAKHDRGGGVLSKRVPAADVAWAGTDINEYYYVPSD